MVCWYGLMNGCHMEKWGSLVSYFLCYVGPTYADVVQWDVDMCTALDEVVSCYAALCLCGLLEPLALCWCGTIHGVPRGTWWGLLLLGYAMVGPTQLRWTNRKVSRGTLRLSWTNEKMSCGTVLTVVFLNFPSFLSPSFTQIGLCPQVVPNVLLDLILALD
jgi:hypothetical protein